MRSDADEQPAALGGAGSPQDAPGAAAIARELTGNLLCVRCAYNLRGLSIRAMCPECQMPVRATILAIVDPMASELKPLGRPRLTLAGLLAWSVGACVAAACVWALRLVEVWSFLFDASVSAWWAPRVGLAGLAASAVGAAALVRPHGGIPRGAVLRAAVGVAAYAPLAAVYWHLHGERDALDPMPYLGAGGMDPMRSVLRLTAAALIAVVIVGLRPNAVRLAARSVVVRTGRVDRQSLLALLAALSVAAAGDLLHLGSGGLRGLWGDLAFSLRVVLIAVGSFLFTIGLFGIVLDCWRLRGVLLARAVGLVDLFDEPARAGART